MSFLSPADLDLFLRIGVGEELLGAAQVRRVTDAEARQLYGIRFTGELSGLVFPYFDPVSGNRVAARLRRDKPELDSAGKPQNKYLCPYGDNRHLYFPPIATQIIGDLAVPVVFVEAEKSALALTAFASRHDQRLLAVATGGCWGWRGKTGIEPGPNGEREETRGPLPDLGLIELQARKVVIAFDSNAASNPKVKLARLALADALLTKGARVYLLEVPEAEAVNGPDDLIAVAGDNAMLALLDDVQELVPPENEHDSSGSGSTKADTVAPDFDEGIGAPPGLPAAAWRGLFTAYRDAMRACSEASDVYHFATMWAAAANALGRRVHFKYGMALYANAYIIVFGPSGDFKTSACRHGAEITEAAGLRVVRGVGSAEGMAGGLGEEPTLFFLEEFTSLLRQGKWDGSTLLPTLTEIFDCPERFQREYRKNPIQLIRPVCTILAGTTEAWFWRDVKEIDFEGGFGNRFVYLTGLPNAPLPRPGIPNLDFAVSELRRLADLPAQEVHLEASAEGIWDHFYLTWRKKRVSPLETAATKRTPAYALKLAMIYAALESTLPEITAEQLTAAIQVATYGAKCARDLIGARFSGANAMRELEGHILGFVRRQPQSTTTKRDVYRALARHYQNSEQFNRAFDAMVRAGSLYTRSGERGRIWISAEPIS